MRPAWPWLICRLVVEHSLVAESLHEGADGEPDVSLYEGAGGIVLQCSNCRRVRRHDRRAWHWVPALVAAPRPRTSHGICPTCAGFYWGVKDPPAPRA